MASTSGSTYSWQVSEHNGAAEGTNGSTVSVKSDAVAVNGPKTANNAPVKYRHVAAVHSRSRISLLSSGHENPTDFVGFRNLMVIVLSKYHSFMLLMIPIDDFVFTVGKFFTNPYDSRHEPETSRGESHEGQYR